MNTNPDPASGSPSAAGSVVLTAVGGSPSSPSDPTPPTPLGDSGASRKPSPAGAASIDFMLTGGLAL